MASILTKYAVRAGCDVFLVGAALDHVHVLLRLTPSTTLASTVQRLKGGAAHEINLRGLLAQHLEWQAGYWAESVSPSDAGPLGQYIRAQRMRHDDSHPAELWQFDDELSGAGV
jgi:REP element-mobilizing transposase RayT